MSWVRHGECNRCGDCCKSGDPYNGTKGESPLGPGICPLLDLVDGVYTCTDRNDHYYLIGCQYWPSMPSHIEEYKDCSYTFEWVED